jgi:DegV family protein with EDD domain
VPRLPVRVVTDSNGDVPAELVARHNIVVVRSLLNIAGKSYRDGLDITRSEFYQRLPQLNPLPTTAAPSSADFEAAYRSCGQAEVVAIHLGATFSAIFTAARLGAEPLGDQVTLIDSQQASMGMGWQVLAAAEAAEAGGSREDVLRAVHSVQERVRLYAALDTIEYLRRGGRASLLSARLGDLLQIKPLLEVRAGRVSVPARVRTRQKARDEIAARVEALGPLARLAVLHTNSPEDAAAMAHRLAPRVQQPPVVVEATAVIGTHVGPGALGLAAVMVESST